MTETFPNISSLFGPGILILFLYLFIGSRRRDTLEKGQKPIIEEQCGGKFGRLNLTIPFVRHALYNDFIVIAYGWTRYILKYSDIADVSSRRHIISKGVTYTHNRKDLPSSIIIWSYKPEFVVESVKLKIKD